MEEIIVDCPCCKSKIFINKDTGLVLKHEELKKGPAGFNDFLLCQKNKKENLNDKFNAAVFKEKNRLNEINEKVNFAKKNLDE